MFQGGSKRRNKKRDGSEENCQNKDQHFFKAYSSTIVIIELSKGEGHYERGTYPALKK